MKSKRALLYGAVALLLLALVFAILNKGDISGPSDQSSNAGHEAVLLLTVEQETVQPVPIDDFDAWLKTVDKPVFVDFGAEWCAYCKLAEPFVEQLAVEYNGRVFVVRIDVDEASALAREYGVQSIPQFSVFKEGKLVESLIGYDESRQDDIREMIGKLLP